uniref:Uncharacterized protein n=1 Tax=Sphaerodactylus townsendi TaxID=933632 RepID=A0ACB8EVY4_9SAUR
MVNQLRLEIQNAVELGGHTKGRLFGKLREFACGWEGQFASAGKTSKAVVLIPLPSRLAPVLSHLGLTAPQPPRLCAPRSPDLSLSVPDALLADLETTTSHISKRPVLLTESGEAHPNGLKQDGTSDPKPPPPPYNPQQQAGPTAMPVEPIPTSALQGGSDKEHLYSTVCKPRSPKPKEGGPPPFSSSSGVLGAGLCELDRLLQELNATQFNITDEIMSQFPTSKSPSGEKGKDKSEDSSDGSSVSRSGVPAKPSATSATLELDKLMASLSDFRVQSNLPAAAPPAVSPPPAPARVSSAQLPVVSSVCPSTPVSPTQTSPAQPSGNLDSMLVMLESDLSRQGISTTAKGLCASCQKPMSLRQEWRFPGFLQEAGG